MSSLLQNLKKVRKTTMSFRYDLNQSPYDYIVEATNRFKGLNLTDRVPEELCMEVLNIVQGAVIKTTPKKKKCNRSAWLSEKALQIAEKRSEAKRQRRKAKIPNAEFQRIARRDKKVFISEQRKEIEENNRMRKTRDFFKKIGDTKGTFHAKMGSIKERNVKDLTEAEDIKKRCKNTQNCTKKVLMTSITTKMWSFI